jgi:hypothetical protein
MSIQSHLDEIISHLGAAVVQRSTLDDIIIANHIDMALTEAKLLKRELAKSNIIKGPGNEIHSQ